MLSGYMMLNRAWWRFRPTKKTPGSESVTLLIRTAMHTFACLSKIKISYLIKELDNRIIRLGYIVQIELRVYYLQQIFSKLNSVRIYIIDDPKNHCFLELKKACENNIKKLTHIVKK